MKISTQPNSLNFCAHPEFSALNKSYNITASSYFRRGQYYGSPDFEFADIINIFKKIFSRPDVPPKKVLIAGIGSSQEPFSYLSVIYNILQKKSLKKNVDLHCVDLQSIPSKHNLFINSFYDSFGTPQFVADSFIKEPSKHGIYEHLMYRVKDEIFKYLWKVYNNTKKTKWETRIQDAIKKYPDSQFDIISMNNVLGYIASPQERNQVVQNVVRCLKKGGIFITDPYKNYSGVYSSLTGLKQCAEGIFEKY